MSSTVNGETSPLRYWVVVRYTAECNERVRAAVDLFVPVKADQPWADSERPLLVDDDEGRIKKEDLIERSLGKLDGSQGFDVAEGIAARCGHREYKDKLEQTLATQWFVNTTNEALSAISRYPMMVRLAKWLKKEGAVARFLVSVSPGELGPSNAALVRHLTELYGEWGATSATRLMRDLSPGERPAVLTEQLLASLREGGYRYLWPEVAEHAKESGCVSYLVHAFPASEEFEAYKRSRRGSGSLRANCIPNWLTVLWNFVIPVEALGEDLARRYAGREITYQSLYGEHGARTPLEPIVYEQALLSLAAARRIELKPKAYILACKPGIMWRKNPMIRFLPHANARSG